MDAAGLGQIVISGDNCTACRVKQAQFGDERVGTAIGQAICD
jgi:hypothetical protein